MKNWFSKTGVDVPDKKDKKDNKVNNNKNIEGDNKNNKNNNNNIIDINKQANYLSPNLKVYESDDEEQIDLNELSNVLHNDSNELQSQLNFLTTVYSELLKLDSENVKQDESITVIGHDITILAGVDNLGDSDGYAQRNKLNNVNGLTMKDASTLLIADTNNKKIKSINLKNGYVSTIKSLDFEPVSIDINSTGEMFFAADDCYKNSANVFIKKSSDKESHFVLGKLPNYPRNVLYSLNETNLVITDLENGNKGVLNLPLLLKPGEISSMHFCGSLFICTLSNIYSLDFLVKADAFRTSFGGLDIQNMINLLDVNWVNIAGSDEESGYLDGAYYHALLRPTALCFAMRFYDNEVNEPGTKKDNSLSPRIDVIPNISTHTLYFLDGSNTLRARSPDGLIYTLISPDPSYTSIAYSLNNPKSILAVEINEFENVIYVAENNRVLRIDVTLEKKPCLFPLSVVPALPDGKIIEARYYFNEVIEKFASIDKSTPLEPLEHEDDDEVIPSTPIPRSISKSTKYKLSLTSPKVVALKAAPLQQDAGRTSAQTCVIS